MQSLIRLRAITGPTKGRIWQASQLLRIGRQDTLEVVLPDTSVSRRHAEIKRSEDGWVVEDSGSVNGTMVNGQRLGKNSKTLHAKDMIQVGEIILAVEAVDPTPELLEMRAKQQNQTPVEDTDHRASHSPGSTIPRPQPGQTPVTTPAAQVKGTTPSSTPPPSEFGDLSHLEIQNARSESWDQALRGLAFDGRDMIRPGDTLNALLRAGQHLANIEREEDLLRSILADAVEVLSAQRGAIVLAEPPDNKLSIRAIHTPESGRGPGFRPPGGRFYFSTSLAQRCFQRGESVLCNQKAEENCAASIIEGAMGSVLCVLLRTPRNRTLGVLHLDRNPFQPEFTPEDLRLANALAANVSAGIECAQLFQKQRDLFLNTINILGEVIELRDKETGGHTRRVTRFALELASELKLPPEFTRLIEIGCPLHDIGKIGIPDQILNKTGGLTSEEFAIMKRHTTMGAEILNGIPDLSGILPIVRNHHERWDGKGYPDGLAGEAISPLARLVTLADSFDAMTSDRPYRTHLSVDEAMNEIRLKAGQQFDPVYAEAFLRIRLNLESIMKTSKSSFLIELPSKTPGS
ncbi:MAG: HD domain-containing phosphohydrolase [Gemmataceae bacterium]